jgi:hypothetical protein
MDYTLAGLVNILRKRLQDEDFDKDSLTIFLNQAQSEILGEDKYPFMERIDEYDDVQSGEISLLPGYAGTLFLFAKRKDGNQRQEMHYISPEEFFDKTASHSFVYTKFANTLFYHLHNKSDNDDDNKYKITHLYIANPLPLVKDTDKPAIPAQYMEALLLGALARAEQQRDNFDYAQIYQNQEDSLLTNMKLRFGTGNLSVGNRARIPFFGGYADGRY